MENFQLANGENARGRYAFILILLQIGVFLGWGIMAEKSKGIATTNPRVVWICGGGFCANIEIRCSVCAQKALLQKRKKKYF